MSALQESAVTAAAPSHGALEGGPQPATADATSPPRDDRNRQLRCSHRRCRLIRARHVVDDRCPRGGGKWKPMYESKGPAAAVRVSMSWSDRENDALCEVLRLVQRSGDPRVVAKMYRKELGNLLGIATRAKMRAARKKSAASAAQNVTPSVDATPLASARDVELAADSFGRVT